MMFQMPSSTSSSPIDSPLSAWLKNCWPEWRRNVPALLTRRTSQWPGYCGGGGRAGRGKGGAVVRADRRGQSAGPKELEEVRFPPRPADVREPLAAEQVAAE